MMQRRWWITSIFSIKQCWNIESNLKHEKEDSLKNVYWKGFVWFWPNKNEYFLALMRYLAFVWFKRKYHLFFLIVSSYSTSEFEGLLKGSKQKTKYKMLNTGNKVQPNNIQPKCSIGIITMFCIIKKWNVAIFFVLLKKSLHLFCNQNSNLHNKSEKRWNFATTTNYNVHFLLKFSYIFWVLTAKSFRIIDLFCIKIEVQMIHYNSGSIVGFCLLSWIEVITFF